MYLNIINPLAAILNTWYTVRSVGGRQLVLSPRADSCLPRPPAMAMWQRQKNFWNELLWKPKKPHSLEALK